MSANPDALKDALAALVAGDGLSPIAMSASMDQILLGQATDAQLGAFAVALRLQGETTEQLTAAAQTLRAHAEVIDLDVKGPLIDTCGTGGDGAGSFNISTVSAIVVAGAGAKVAKHGNRAVSSRCGSADVLEELGIRLGGGLAQQRRCIETAGIAFLFAPAHHGALRHAAGVRQQLGMRTFFNLLGPLANPAGATHQVVGVYERARVRSMAEVLGKLGLQAAWVVHGDGGLDEISPAGETHVAAFKQASEHAFDQEQVHEFTLRPADFGLDPVSLSSLEGGDAAENATIARRVLAGDRGGPRTAVLINAAAALVVAGYASSPAEGAVMASDAIDDGRAAACLQNWAQISHG